MKKVNGEKINRKFNSVLFIGIILSSFMIIGVAYNQKNQDIRSLASQEDDAKYCVNQPSCCDDIIRQLGQKGDVVGLPDDEQPYHACEGLYSGHNERGYCRPEICNQLPAGVKYRGHCGWYWYFHDPYTNSPDGYGCMIGCSESSMRPKFVNGVAITQPPCDTQTTTSPTPAGGTSPSVTPGSCSVTAPSALNISWSTSTKASLVWTAGSGGVKQLLRIGENASEVNNGCPGNLGTLCVVKENELTATQTSYTSGDVFTSGKSYFFRLVNYKDSTCFKDIIASSSAVIITPSVPSPTSSSTCSITSPTNLTVTWNSATKATVKWSAGTGGSLQKLRIGTDFYEVTNGCPGNLGNPCIVKEESIPSSQSSYTTSDVFSPGKSYFFRIANYKDASCWKDITTSSAPVIPTPTSIPTSSPTSAPTPTPSAIPSSTPVPTLTTAPTVTPTPGQLPIIRFKAKLASVQRYPDMYLKLRIKDDLLVASSHAGGVITFSSQSICDNPPTGVKDYYIPVHADGSGVYTPVADNSIAKPSGVTIPVISSDGWITLPDQTGGKKYTIVLKAPKTRGKRTVEHILLSGGKQSQEFDWTSIPLEPGDLPNPSNSNKQDCVINSLDISLVISRLGKTDKTNLDIADVNYDGVVNGNDLSKIIPSIAREDDEI